MTPPEAPARRILWVFPAAALVAAVAYPFLSLSQPAAPAPQAQASAPVQPRPAPAHPASSATKSGSKGLAVARSATHPLWRELAPGQQQALAPLAAHWDTLNEPQKRKWIALSANFPKMSGEEQAKLHSRMTEWVALSPQQRSIARLNYGATQKIPADDKKAKWEAYQALSPEEKKKLAARAAKPPATAAAVRPMPAEKLATVPRTHQPPATKAPRIAAAPNQVDHNTLLPQRAPVTAPAPAPAPVPAAVPAVVQSPQPPSSLPPHAGTD